MTTTDSYRPRIDDGTFTNKPQSSPEVSLGTSTKISKVKALTMLKEAEAVTMDRYEVRGADGQFTSRTGGVVGLRRKVTGVRSNGVCLDGSWSNIDAAHDVELDGDGRLVVSGKNAKGEPWVRMTYTVV